MKRRQFMQVAGALVAIGAAVPSSASLFAAEGAPRATISGTLTISAGGESPDVSRAVVYLGIGQ